MRYRRVDHLGLRTSELETSLCAGSELILECKRAVLDWMKGLVRGAVERCVRTDTVAVAVTVTTALGS